MGEREFPHTKSLRVVEMETRGVDTTPTGMGDVLQLEFEGGYYPYSYINEEGNVSGALLELWTIVAQVAKLRLQISRSEGRMATAQNVISNRTFALLDSMSLNVERHRMFLVSVPFGYYEANFYESARDVDSETTELFFFTVFRLNAVLLLLLSYLICSICSLLLARNSHNHRVSSQFEIYFSSFFLIPCLHLILEKVVAAFFLISLTLLVFHHSAGFQGNNFIVRKAKETTYNELVQGMRGGVRTAIEQVPDQFPPEEVAILTSKNKDAIIYEPDNKKILERLCTDRKASALLYSNQILQIGQIDHPCELSTVKVNSDVNRELSQYNHSAYSLGVSMPGYFLYSKGADRRMIRLVNQVVLKLFQQDNFDNFWAKRHLKSLRKLPSAPTTDNQYSSTNIQAKPMNFLRLSIIFYLFAGALVFCILTFICEVISPLIYPKEKVYQLAIVKYFSTRHWKTKK